MKGAGKVTVYDFNPEEDAQSMSIFEGGEGKDKLEAYFAARLGPDDGKGRDETSESRFSVDIR
jgi:hypothetical protein